MLELVEIQKVVSQGMTKPLLCKGSNGKTYYAKGKQATASGLIRVVLTDKILMIY
jgi:hypothetical protein